jgi:peptidoglycan/LPS O-acetylase OafA/YrhL
VKHLALAVAVLLAVVLGALAVVAGEADDSPGLQGLGVLLAVGAVVLGVRSLRRGRRR